MLNVRSAGPPLPPIAELTAATTALARGLRRKTLLPLASSPTEYALVRRGERVLVSSYETGSAPEVHQLDHEVSLADLLEACARATLESARLETDPTARQIAVRMAERAMRTNVSPDPSPVHAQRRSGGTLEAPKKVALAFGFEARIHPSPASSARSARADVHAMLFDGQLWAWVRGKRVELCRGPILLAVLRMVVAVRALVDAWESGRTTSVRLRAGDFAIALRLDMHDEASLTLSAGGEEVGAAALDVPKIALPILRLASDLLRALVSVDRAQSRNLRINALRDEVRALRRTIREHARHDGFVNRDPDSVRLGVLMAQRSKPVTPEPPPALRFDARWRIALDGLDANAVYFCGDRLVLNASQHTIAVDRDGGEVLWAREGAASTFMASSTLVRLSPEGDVELCSIEDGEPYAVTRVAPRVGGPHVGLAVGGGALPPMVVLAEGSARLVAIDLRTGEPRWRFGSRRSGSLRLLRAGRLLLVACGGAIHALDISSGEDVWRFAMRTRFPFAPALADGTVVAVGDGARPRVYGVDLFSGERRWSLPLPGRPAATPLGAGRLVLAPLDRDRLVAIDVRAGVERWCERDPGLGLGGAALWIDNALVVNSPGGMLSAVDLASGEERWGHVLGDALADEVPRNLEPVLRGGGLFVPAANVHLVRPTDGELLGELPCELVPDRMRVDERGWCYVAEESGHVAAYAPAPQLRMIRGGK